jgi:beta-glucanase (GH16 family)
MLNVGAELQSGFERLRRLAIVGALSKSPDSSPNCPPPVAEASPEASPGLSEFSAEPTWEQNFRTQPDGPVDRDFWRHELDPVVPTYNDEAQAYTSNERNVRVEDGCLIIEAHRENYTDPAGRDVEFTSGRIDTRDSLNFEYGKVEVTMVLPEGAGAWPAFWFLSANNPHTTALDPTDEDWEKDRFYLHDGEIDGMEAGEDGHVTKIDQTVHTFLKSHGKDIIIPDATTTPHTYGVEVTPTAIRWTIDGETKFTYKKTSNNLNKWPFAKGNKLCLILNLAMGGNYAGNNNIDPERNSWVMQIFDVKYYPYEGKAKTTKK